MPMNNIFIGCSSQESVANKYKKEAEQVAMLLNKYDLVFGGVNRGEMGIFYRYFKKNNKKIYTSVIDRFFDETKQLEMTEKNVTINTGSTTDFMFSKADFFLFLPGGFGTLMEIFAAIHMNKTEEIAKPIIIYNFDHFFDDIIAIMEKLYNENFAIEKNKNIYYVVNNIDELKEILNEISF